MKLQAHTHSHWSSCAGGKRSLGSCTLMGEQVKIDIIEEDQLGYLGYIVM